MRPDAAGPYEAVAQLLAAAGGRRRLAGCETGLPGPRREALLAGVERWSGEGEASGERRERDALLGDWIDALDALTRERPAVWLRRRRPLGVGDLVAFLCDGGDATVAGRPAHGGTHGPPTSSVSIPGGAGEIVELPRLDGASAEALVRALVGSALPDELVARIVAASDGNPQS